MHIETTEESKWEGRMHDIGVEKILGKLMKWNLICYWSKHNKTNEAGAFRAHFHRVTLHTNLEAGLHIFWDLATITQDGNR
jgi:hypothetical protein